MKGFEQSFPVVLYRMPYNVVLTIRSVDDDIVKCGHSNESSTAVFK